MYVKLVLLLGVHKLRFGTCTFDELNEFISQVLIINLIRRLICIGVDSDWVVRGARYQVLESLGQQNT